MLAGSRLKETSFGVWPLAGVVVQLAFGGAALAHAESQAGHKVPKRSHPVPISRTAPDTTATVRQPQALQPRPSAPPPADDLSINAPLPPPFELPSASRSVLRECGEQWQAKKMAGTAGTDTWREFATVCLAAAAGPTEARGAEPSAADPKAPGAKAADPSASNSRASDPIAPSAGTADSLGH